MTGQSWFFAVGWRHLVAIGAIIFALIPILFVASAAFNPLGTLSSTVADPEAVRARRTSRTCSSRTDFARWFLNSILIAGCATFFSLALATFAAFAFSRYRFSGRRPGLLFLLIVQMFPAFLAIVTIYIIFTKITDLYPLIGFNTPWSLVLLYLGGALGVNTWLIKGFFDTVPRELDESAKVDGASHTTTFFQIILPLVVPILVVVGLLGFIGAINEFLMASVFLTQGDSKTLAVGPVRPGRRRTQRELRDVRRRHAAHGDPDGRPVLLDSSATSSAASPPVRSRVDRAPDGGHAEEPPRLGPPRRLGPLRRSRSAAPTATGCGSATRSGCACGRASTRRSTAIFLRTAPDGEQVLDELVEVAPGPACRWCEIAIRLTMPTTDYRFLVVGAGGHLVAQRIAASTARTATDRDDFRLVAGFDPPAWLADRVFYQVFPDRFANGDPATTSHDGAWTYRGQPTRRRAWEDRPSDGRGRLGRVLRRRPGRPRGPARPPRRPRRQRDLPQPDLRLAVEPRLRHDRLRARRARTSAATTALGRLRRATRARDIRADPRHRARTTPAPSTRGSSPRRPTRPPPTAGYFIVPRAARRLRVVAGRQVAAQARLPRRRACARRCTRARARSCAAGCEPPFSVDGWRIDVANMLGRQGPVQLGRGGRPRACAPAVKDANPDAYLMGEHFYDATDALDGDQWDGVMNYAGFTNPGPRVAERRRAPQRGVRHRRRRRGPDDRRDGRHARRLPGRDPVGGRPLPVRPARQPRHAAGPDGRRRPGPAAGRVRAAVRLRRRARRSCTATRSGLEGEEGNASRARRCRGTRRPGTSTTSSFVRALVRYRVRSRALQAGGFQVLETGDDCARVPARHGRRAGDRGRRARPGVAHGRPRRWRIGAIADGTVFTSLLTGERATVAGGRLPLPPTPPGAAFWRSGE